MTTCCLVTLLGTLPKATSLRPLLRRSGCPRRKARAAAHATNGFTSIDGVEFLQGEDNLASYKVDDARYFTQVFCKTCGAKMPRLDPERGIAVIPFGALDDDPGVEAQDHIFVDYKAGWHRITDDLPTFAEMAPD